MNVWNPGGDMNKLSSELTAAIKPLETRLRLLWIGVFPTFAIYVFLAWQRVQTGSNASTASPQLLMIFALISVMALVEAFVFRWFTFSPRAIANLLNGKQPALIKALANPDSPKARAMQNPEILDRLEGPERRLYEYSGCLFSVMFIQWGMVSTCAIFGMILPSAEHQPWAAVATGAASACCMLFFQPAIRRAFAAGLELAEFEKGLHKE